MWLVRGTYLHWLYVGHKKLGVGCVLVVCVGRVLVGPILVVTYDQISGFGGRTLVVGSYDHLTTNRSKKLGEAVRLVV